MTDLKRNGIKIMLKGLRESELDTKQTIDDYKFLNDIYTNKVSIYSNTIQKRLNKIRKIYLNNKDYEKTI